MPTGSCHCGAVRYDVAGEYSNALECNCSHCSRKGYLLWFVPRDALQLRSGDADLSTYTFNQHRIEHRFCKHCGCAPFGLGTGPDGQPMAAINLRCIEGIDLQALQRVPYDGLAL